MAIQRVKSKLAKTEVLNRNENLRDFIPLTRKLTEANLHDMLARYSMLYAKPDLGTFGQGVIRIESSDNGYRFQLGTSVHRYNTLNGLYQGILQHKKKGVYVVQRGIHLLKHKGRRFDIRVMVQQTPKGEWESTGIIGRLAHPSRIVTNYHSGGTPMSFATLTGRHMSAERRRSYIDRLRRLGISVARQLQTQYPRIKELGLDVAIDTEFKPWLLEVNTRPDPYIFRKLENKSVFRKIYRYAVAYGRYKAPRAQRTRRTVRTIKRAAR